ncbi:MAG: FtsW/RodA/SpoVE family cell cycle protein [Lachnospiraceae bacterium]|nr:FtsW/RodA/SpoVE family cell cycle protein [Lachnospiraceae bacterium]
MNEFIKTLTEQIRCVKARDGVAREVSDHILDQAAAYEESGMEHDQAVEKAVHEMGDPVEIGVSLDRIHQPQMNWKLILITFVLTMAGLLVMYSIYGLSTIVSRQCIFAAAGLAVILAVNFIDYSVIGRFGYLAYILMTVVLFIVRLSFPSVNGRVPALAILVYLYAPIFAGILYRLRGGSFTAVIKGIALIFLTSCLAAKFGSSWFIGLNMYMILLIMLLTSVRKDMFRVNQRIVTFLTVLLGMLPLIVPFVMQLFPGGGFRKERISAFLYRKEYNQTAGYGYAAIDAILDNSHLVGKGNETVYAASDFCDRNNLVLLRLMHSYGLITGVVLLILFIVFAVGVMKIVQSQKNQLGMLVSASCFLVFVANCLEGILVNLGLCPMTTVSIPFITFGGSVTLVYSILIGLILSVHRYEKVIPSRSAAQSPKWRISVKLERHPSVEE